MKINRRSKKSFPIILLVLFSLFLFFFSLALYLFPSLIPRFSFGKDANLVRPNEVNVSNADFKKALTESGVQFESLVYASESPTLVVSLPQGAYAYLDATQDASSQAKLLEDILSRVSIDNPGKNLRYVDLRFDKAIVKFR